MTGQIEADERWAIQHESDSLLPGAMGFPYGALAPADQRLAIPAGTLCQLCRVEESGKWFKHETKTLLEFDRYDRETLDEYHFQHLGFFIRVQCDLVEQWFREFI